MGQTPSELTPHASPRHYWGAELRAAREQRKLSLARLGVLIHRDRSYIAKIERGEKPIPANLAADCDLALDTGGALRRLHDLVTGADGWRLLQASDVANSQSHVASLVDHVATTSGQPELWEGSDGDISVPARTADGQVIYVTLPRRVFLQGSAAAADAALTGAPFVAAAAPNPQALPSAMLAPDANPVSHFRQMKRVLMDSDNLFGPAQVIANVQHQIEHMQALRQSWRGEDYLQLVSVQTQFADLLGWLHQDSGDFQKAQYWIDRSLEWAHSAREPITAAFTLARRSQLAADMGKKYAADALDAAEASASMSHNTSARIAAVATTFAAHAHAMRGDALASARSYDTARTLLERAADDEPGLYGLFLNNDYISVYEGHSLAALGQHAHAANRFKSAIATLPSDYHRDRGVYLAWQALAHAGAADLDSAVDTGTRALQIASETHSSRIAQQLSELKSVLTTLPSSPAAQDLQSNIAVLVGTDARKV